MTAVRYRAKLLDLTVRLYAEEVGPDFILTDHKRVSLDLLTSTTTWKVRGCGYVLVAVFAQS